jgi:phosphatidylglycerophosphatase A
VIARAVATLFGLGYLRPAPGSWGSLGALPFAWAVAHAGGPWLYMLAGVLLYPLGLWATREVTAGRPDHDPGEVVIDEALGQWIALLPVIWGAALAGVPPAALWPGWVAAFVFFRLFDIWKPGPVGWADRKAGPVGVMLDDVVAGVMAAMGVSGLGLAAHAILL